MDEKTRNRLKGIQTSLRISGFDISDEALQQTHARHRAASVSALMENLCRCVDAEVRRTGRKYYDVLRELSDRLFPKLK